MARARLYALAGIVGLLVAGLVVLLVTGRDTSAFLAVASPVFAAFLVLAGVERNRDASELRHAETVGKLETITHQTNGVLSSRIQAAVTEALTAAGVTAAGAPLDPLDVIPPDELDPLAPAGG